MKLKEIFDNADGALTWEQFESLLPKGVKFVDLSEGEYVSKSKYEDDLSAKDNEIATLNTNITSRDTDLADLQKRLESAGVDAEKLASVSTDLSTLQTKYENDTKAYKEQLKKQAYEFAVKEYASGKKFTSNAAKRDFISSMIAKGLKMDNGTILGAEDFAKTYSESNADAFVSEVEPEPIAPLPTFVAPTQGSEPPVDSTGGFSNAFNFVGVRKHE